MWADSLTTEEVEATLEAANCLKGIRWATPLLDSTRSILDRLRAGQKDKAAYRENPIQPSQMPFLFEIRFARALAAAGLSAEYENRTGVGNSSVDFRVNLDPLWLIELVSLRQSQAIRNATWSCGPVSGYILTTDAADPRQSEEGEMLKAQQRIADKVFDRQHGPIKFPRPEGAIHMVMVDARGYIGSGRGDNTDWRHLILGPHGLPDNCVHYWTNPKTQNRVPICGLFEPSCPLDAAKTVRERVHLIGFVCERFFSQKEIKNEAFYVCNPALVDGDDAVRSAILRWPLMRQGVGVRRDDASAGFTDDFEGA